MKGRSKDSAKFHQAKDNDIYLESKDPKGKSYGKKNPQSSLQQTKQSKNIIEHAEMKRIPLTNDAIKEFACAFSPEIERCYYNMSEIKALKDMQALDAYKDVYEKFETIPVLFLSVVPREAVYVWQINRKCPFKKGTNHMIVDSKAVTLETKPHISVLMLAKITPEKDEEILSAKFLDDKKLMVRSKPVDHHNKLVIRLYEIKNFIDIAIVNAFEFNVLANDLYTSKILVHGLKIDGQNGLKVSLFKKEIKEEQKLEDITKEEEEKGLDPIKLEELKDTKICKNLHSPFQVQEISFSESYIDSNNVLLLISKEDSTIIALKNNLMITSCLYPDIGQIESVFSVKDHYYIVSTDKVIYVFNLGEFPLFKVENTGVVINPREIELPNLNYHPKKLYEIVLDGGTIPKVYCIENTSISSQPIQNNNQNQKLYTSFWGICNKTKTLNWTLCGSSKHTYIFYIYHNYCYLCELLEGESRISKDIHIPYQIPGTFKIWNIIGTGDRLILCGKGPNGADIQLIEMKTNRDEFGPLGDVEFQLVHNEDKTFRYNELEDLFGQIEGPNQEITFIRFENEPFYLDSVNLIYDEPISLINPYIGSKANV